MKYHGQLKFFENLESEGHYVPALENKPLLHSDLVNDFNIFIELSRNRQRDGMSGTASPISFLEIEAYFRLTRIDVDHQQRLLKRIKFMDNIYCNHVNTEKK